MYTFIINPNSRTGRGLNIWKSLEAILEEREIKYRAFMTEFPGHATKIVSQLTSDQKKHKIIALGGDGTMNEVVNGITDFSKVTLGYVPIGSSNDFARSVGIPQDPVQALEAVLNPGHIRRMDVGRLTQGDQTCNFAVSAGIGFDAAICHQEASTNTKTVLNKIGLGKLTYVGIALKMLVNLRPQKMTVTLDDHKKIEFKNAYFATAMNHPYEGGGCKFCPKADYSDKLLDVIVVANLSRLKILFLLPTAFIGKHVLFKGVYTYTCKKADFVTEAPYPIHTDGEPINTVSHMTASLHPDQLYLITK